MPYLIPHLNDLHRKKLIYIAHLYCLEGLYWRDLRTHEYIPAIIPEITNYNYNDQTEVMPTERFFRPGVILGFLNVLETAFMAFDLDQFHWLTDPKRLKGSIKNEVWRESLIQLPLSLYPCKKNIFWYLKKLGLFNWWTDYMIRGFLWSESYQMICLESWSNSRRSTSDQAKNSITHVKCKDGNEPKIYDASEL